MEDNSFLPSCFDSHLYVYVCEIVYHMCVGAWCAQKRAPCSLELKLQAVWGHLIGFWELNLDPLEEEDEKLLATEPSLQILKAWV